MVGSGILLLVGVWGVVNGGTIIGKRRTDDAESRRMAGYRLAEVREAGRRVKSSLHHLQHWSQQGN